MGNVKAFTNRLNGGEKRIAWREEDIPQLAKNVWRAGAEGDGYLATEEGGHLHNAHCRQGCGARGHAHTLAIHSERRDEGSGWGHCSCRGIKLDAYHKNPVWTWQHDYNRPIGRSIKTWKENGKLKSIVELAVGLMPDADMVQNLLVKKMLSACSIPPV